MFQHILVPLDGSLCAEQALPVASKLARATHGTISLLRVAIHAHDTGHYIVPAMGAPYDFYGEVPEVSDDANFKEELSTAKSYLEEVARSPLLDNVPVTCRTVVGAAPAEILSIAHLPAIDSIVMCSHGYTGFKHWMLGSVTEQVIRHSDIPVLVLHENAGGPTNLHPGGIRPVRVLAALDGSQQSEEILAPAAYLSAALSAPLPGALHVTRVIRLPLKFDYGQKDQLTEVVQQSRQEVGNYLKGIEQTLRAHELATLDLQVSASTPVNMDVADTLIRMAEDGEFMGGEDAFVGCDVIAMATHGREGVQRWMMGSVTERVFQRTKLPMLIMHPS